VATDEPRLFAAQAVRAFSYGLGAVLLGTSLEQQGWSSGRAALLYAAVLTGTVVANVVVGARADRWGRRATYARLCVLLLAAGAVLATTDHPAALFAVALTGALSTDVIESGPFTTLEQAMLGTRRSGQRLLRGLGTYNAIAAAAGSLGALAAGMTIDRRAFAVLAVAGAAAFALTRRLSPAVEVDRVDETAAPAGPAPDRQGEIRRLAVLFSLDSFGGGFVAQSYLAFFLADRFDASPSTVGATFAALGVLSTISFLLAPVLGGRIGLLETMVVTHVPSSVFLAAVVFAPSLPLAVACLAARALLSQMDVPTRQAFLLALVGPRERSRAIATTNTARYLTRPVGAALAGGAASLAVGAPLLAAALIKVTYDAAVWRTFRDVPLRSHPSPRRTTDDLGDPVTTQDRSHRVPVADRSLHRPGR